MHVSTIFVLLLQIVLILMLSRLMGALASRLRQPKVVGEMLAGIMLGPSLLGWIAPDAWAYVFPPQSIRLLDVLAQIGVIFFLFLIGLELDPKLLRKRGHAAVIISHVSIIAPFLLGAALTLFLYPLVFNDTPTMRFTAVALFMGAAMSLTAFPVLARILTERGLNKTQVGAVAITCAAVDDVSAWCMLAFVLAIGRADGIVPGLITLGLSAAYVIFMIGAVRPLLARFERLYQSRDISVQIIFPAVLVLILLSAATTEWIGIHALFGAFLMGAIMPKDPRFGRLVTDRLEDLTVIFLLPIFFAYAGLRTQIGLLDTPSLWGLTALIILVACIGKFGGSTLAARACGMGWRESSAIGILMNTRGLVELVILTIGLQMGVISDAVFAMMVLMALVTTAMTTPILDWVYPQKRFEPEPSSAKQPAEDFTLLVPIYRSESGPGLARIAAALGRGSGGLRLRALSLDPFEPEETLGASLGASSPAADALGVLVEQSRMHNLAAEPISFTSRDIPSDIARVARATHADLILMGYHQPIFGQAILGGTVQRVLTGADTDVAVLVDRGVKASTLSILVPYQGTPHDRLAVDLVRRMAAHPDVSVTILHVVPKPSPGSPRTADAGIRKQSFPDSVEVWVVEDSSPVEAVLRQSGDFNLIVVGLSEEWGFESHFFGLRAERIAREWAGSLLLVRKHTSPPEIDAAAEARPGATIEPDLSNTENATA